MIASVQAHIRHHARFYAAAAFGAVVGLATEALTPALRFMVAGDSFFVLYLGLTGALAFDATPEDMRQRSAYEDEGGILIVLMTLPAIALILGSISALVNRDGEADALQLTLAVASIPLGWLTLHTLVAFRYAHLYYTRAGGKGRKRRDAGGIGFPETPEPTTWDFLYFSFVVGMTAQVSDVPVLNTTIRRLTLTHT